MLKIKCLIRAFIYCIKPKQKGKHDKQLADYPVLEKLNILSENWKN